MEINPSIHPRWPICLVSHHIPIPIASASPIKAHQQKKKKKEKKIKQQHL
jgi:hypothetical protein